MGVQLTPLLVDFANPPIPVPPFEAAYIVPVLSNISPMVYAIPVLPTSVHEGAAPPPGVGGDGGFGLLEDEPEPPPQAIYSRQANTAKVRKVFVVIFPADGQQRFRSGTTRVTQLPRPSGLLPFRRHS